MAQTTTVVKSAGIGDMAKMKLVVLNIANGASETSAAVDFSLYGLGTVFTYGLVRRDTYTAGIDFSNHSGTTVTYTWTATDVANVLVWALGQ